MGFAGIIAAAVFLADLIVKTYLRLNFSHSSIPLIENIFHITVVFNKGAAFGILQGQTTFLIITSLIFIILFFFLLKDEGKKGPLHVCAFGLILGGAASNLCDRIFLGFVVDYLDFRIWPVFNISDSCISIGVGILIFQSFKKTKVPAQKTK